MVLWGVRPLGHAESVRGESSPEGRREDALCVPWVAVEDGAWLCVLVADALP